MTEVGPKQSAPLPASGPADNDVQQMRIPPVAARLRKHADYQRAYKASRKQFSPSMTYFHAIRQPDLVVGRVPRVGITAGRVLGKAVERNRIKRRLREAIRVNQSLLPAGIDVILHPRRLVLDMKYAELQLEISRIFSKIAGVGIMASDNTSSSRATKPR